MSIRMTGVASFTALLGAVIGATTAYAGQPLETETARLPEKGHGSVQVVGEYQTSNDGSEAAVPLVFEYGITDRLEIAVEPVAFAAVNPKTGRSASGFGDTEVTLTYLLAHETGQRPALAIAGEIKFPTTNDPLLGTGATDYRVFGIASKRIGRFDLHANLGYTFVGDPSGTSLDDIFDYAVAAEYEMTPHSSLVAEILGNTSAGGNERAVGVSQEVASTSVTGLIGGVYRPTKGMEYSVGATYDNNNAALLRTGLTFRF